MHTESSRDTSRVAQWVSEHRAVVQQLLAHCLRVAFDAPQRDVAQVMLGAAYLCLRPERGQSTGPATLGRDLFDALPRLISFPMCRPPEIATILWALASCGVSTPALFSSAATAIGPHLQYTLEAAAANAATNGNGAAATSAAAGAAAPPQPLVLPPRPARSTNAASAGSARQQRQHGQQRPHHGVAARRCGDRVGVCDGAPARAAPDAHAAARAPWPREVALPA